MKDDSKVSNEKYLSVFVRVLCKYIVNECTTCLRNQVEIIVNGEKWIQPTLKSLTYLFT